MFYDLSPRSWRKWVDKLISTEIIQTSQSLTRTLTSDCFPSNWRLLAPQYSHLQNMIPYNNLQIKSDWVQGNLGPDTNSTNPIQHRQELEDVGWSISHLTNTKLILEPIHTVAACQLR